jgi:NlpC/P60 family putative phage cell wall peptidase
MTRPDEIIAAARSFLGTPYRHRASVPGAGADCLGLIIGVARTLYGNTPDLPPYGPDWRDNRHRRALEALADTWLIRTAAPGPGAVLLFRLGPTPLPRHCGILTGPDQFIHAQEGLGVVEASLGPWAERVSGSFLFP